MTPARVLVADPPWKFGDALGKRGAVAQYPCMDVEQIAIFELPPLADDCYLFLWRVASMQLEAFQVAQQWGFTIKTELVWRKLTRHGRPHFGMGRHLRASHETCLVAVRGKPKPYSHSIRSVFDAQVGRHSEKPDAFYQLVEQFSEGPYVELFARKRRKGWIQMGDELEVAA